MQEGTQLAQTKLHIAKNLALPLDAITQKFAFLGRSGAGKTYGAGKFVEELLDAGAQVVILDPVGNWYGLRLAADGKSPGIPIPIFGGDRGDIPLLHTGGALVADLVVDKGISVVLDVHHFRKHERKEFMTQFAEQLFHRKKSARSPMHVVIEEAQVFVPQKAFKGEERLLGAMEDLCKLGRNYGIGNTLISQRPQAVNKDVLNQTGTLFVFNMTGPQERKVMEGWIVEQGVDMTAVVNELPSLPNGTAYVWSPQWLEKFEKVQIGEKRTYDASATPVFGKVEKARSLAPVDLAQIQEAMQSTIEKAKESDPKELQKKIRELQAELKRKHPTAVVDESKWREAEKVWQQILSKANRDVSDLRKQNAGLIRLLERIAHLADARPLDVVSTSGDLEYHKKVISPTVSPAPRRARGNSHDTGSAEVGTGGLRRILTALAQCPNGLTKQQIGVRAGLSSKSGSFGTYLGKARSSGWVDDRGGKTFITEAGLEALGSFEELPTGKALLDYWLHELGKSGAARMLQTLYAAEGQPISKAELGERTGLSAQSGSFGTYLGRLRSLELVDGPGEALVASTIFYEE
jgi:uncharacterized protein